MISQRKNKKNDGFTPLKSLTLSKKLGNSWHEFINSDFLTGFTLIEVTVAMAIFILVIIGIIQMFPVGIQIRKSAEQATVASNLAAAKIESLVSMPYEDIIVGEIEPRTHVSPLPSDPFYEYERQTLVTYVDPNNNLTETVSDLGMKKIKTTVYWRGRIGSQEKSIEVITLLTDL